MPEPLDVAVLGRFADLVVESLGAAREEIDALNVYPVPDGDTGTNMFLTLESARDALAERMAGGCELGPALAAYARGALLGARGNSGVILSELVGALARRVSRARPSDDPGRVWAEAVRAASDAAWAAVGTPVEGTILSVAAAAAHGAETAAKEPGATLEDVVRAGGEAARTALELTPEQLPLLRDAGVVDAGGRGLVVVLDAVEAVATGRRPLAPRARAIPVPHEPIAEARTGDLSPEGPAYEVMYLLDTEAAAEENRIAQLRATLAPLGDSLVVVGGEGLWNVHVHVDDVGAAVEAGIAAGTPRRIRVTHFAEQVRRAAGRTRAGRSVVVVAAGDGLAAIFAEAGAVVVPGGPGRRPSTGELLAAVVGSGTEEVIVLPNDHDSAAVAEVAARQAGDQGVHVVVVPTSAQVQGIAALAVHEPARSLEADVVAMTAAARHARHAAVTVATKRAMTSAGPCEPGDVLGAIEGDFVAVGTDPADVACGILDRLLDSGGELVTLVAGQDGDEVAAAAEAHVERHFPGVDVVRYDGGQDRYPLLLAVE